MLTESKLKSLSYQVHGITVHIPGPKREAILEAHLTQQKCNTVYSK